MNTPSIAAGTAAATSSGGAVIILMWVASLVHVPLPPEVAVSLAALLTPLIHIVARAISNRLGVEIPAPATPAAPAAPQA